MLTQHTRFTAMLAAVFFTIGRRISTGCLRRRHQAADKRAHL